jgi:hypothetical protein
VVTATATAVTSKTIKTELKKDGRGRQIMLVGQRAEWGGKASGEHELLATGDDTAPDYLKGESLNSVRPVRAIFIASAEPSPPKAPSENWL